MSIRTGHLFRAYAAAPLGVERDSQGRVWCQLFPLETWHRSDFPGGKLELTPALMQQFLANWRSAGAPPLPVDYEHEEQGPASGWIEDLRLGPAGELQGAIKWTDEAAEDIKADKRRYLSPTWAMQHSNRRTGTKGGPWLYGAALTNSPFFDSMPRVAASAAAPTTHHPTEALRGEEQHMDKKRICAALGLPEETEDEKVMEAIEAAMKKTASHEDAAKLHASDVEKHTAALKDTEAKLKASQDEVAALKASVLERDVDSLIASGKAAGKALEPMREFVLKAAVLGGLDEAKKFIASFPATVPVKAEGEPVKPEEKPLDTAAAKARFEMLVEEQLKAGAKSTDAYRLVQRAHPELAAKAFPSTSTTR